MDLLALARSIQNPKPANTTPAPETPAPTLVGSTIAQRGEECAALCDQCAQLQDARNKLHRELDESRERIAALERELAEARNDRKAQQVVTTNAFGLRFHGPQGHGTANRIKALGGHFKITSKRGEPIKGYWILPASDAGRNLSLELSQEGKQVEPFAL